MGMDRPTLLDIARTQDPNGSAAMIIETLTQKNEILQDAPAFPSNAPMGERTTLRSSLPTVQFAQINKGTSRSKGSYQQRVDTIAILDALSEVDVRTQKLYGAAAIRAYRNSEDRGFLEALAQTVALATLVGDELLTPQSFTGLTPRLNSLASGITGSQVHSMGSPGGGDTTSIFVVDWGRDGAHMIYPGEGAGVAGLSTMDKGEERVSDVDGLPFYAHVTQYEWFVGLAVKDLRHIGRLANIDRSDALLASPTQGQLTDKLSDLMSAMSSPTGLMRVLYTHRDIIAAFRRQVLNKSNNALSIEDHLGEKIPHYWGYPIRALDQMPGAEDTVT